MSKVVSACVALAIGPVTARAIELLLASKRAGGGTMSMLLVTWSSILAVQLFAIFCKTRTAGILWNFGILP